MSIYAMLDFVQEKGQKGSLEALLLCFVAMAKELPDNQEGDESVMGKAALPDTQQYPDTVQDALTETPTPVRARSPESSVVSESRGKAVEGMSWQELEYLTKGHQYCQHCQMPVDVTTGTVVRKKTHRQVSCKQCHNTVTLLYRHYDLAKLKFKELPAEEAHLLYKKARDRFLTVITALYSDI